MHICQEDEDKKGVKFYGMKFSKIVIAGLLVYLAAFTIAMSICAFVFQYEPGALITCVFAFAGAEGGALAMIKIFEKEEKEGKKNDRSDNDHRGGDGTACGGDYGVCDSVDQEKNDGRGQRAD